MNWRKREFYFDGKKKQSKANTDDDDEEAEAEEEGLYLETTKDEENKLTACFFFVSTKALNFFLQISNVE